MCPGGRDIRLGLLPPLPPIYSTRKNQANSLQLSDATALNNQHFHVWYLRRSVIKLSRDYSSSDISGLQ
jgi:hypothetical protein